ncbi:MAG: IscS subfamily cysteine desulfurase [Dysgonamonadaceae bacterium]|nr:IscS subfamily cysteine desulfurase [Dysgonamonadaceae bacterium]
MIYLDYNATAPLMPEVFEAMRPFLTERWGNPSSSYSFGAKLKAEIEAARRDVAALINANSQEIIFTGSATESNNTALSSALLAAPEKRHIVTSLVEHQAVLNHVSFLERNGYSVTYLPVDSQGLIDMRLLEKSITKDTAVVSLMWANNETGVLFPVKEISAVCKSKGVLFHCDAVQAASKVQVDVKDIYVDYLSLSAHKLKGPKGIGGLFVRKGVYFSPYLNGGHQERGRRGGTENVAGIIGFGKAAEIAKKELSDYEKRVAPLRDMLEQGLLTIDNTELNGHPTYRLPNTSNITFHGVEAESLLLLLDKEGICASSGSACLSDSEEPSYVISAMKGGAEIKRQNIRFSLGTKTTYENIEYTISAVKNAVTMLRK